MRAIKLLPLTLLLCSLDGSSALAAPSPRRYAVHSSGTGARGRGGVSAGRTSRGGRGRGRKQEQAEAARRIDLFGEPGEWRARRRADHLREWRSRGAGEDEGGAATQAVAEGGRGRGSSYYRGGAAAKPFEPKVWSTEAGGGRPPAFFAKEAASFAEVGASDEVQAALAVSGLERPSHVQAASFRPILRGEDVALADQTGSGKTIAYLAPIVQALRDIEAADGRTADGQVRALVLVPTSELAQQVLTVAKGLAAGGVPFRSSIITGEHKWRTQAQCAARGLELLVCTPGRLRAHLLAEHPQTGAPNPSFTLAACRHVVLDEADLLLEDDDFDATWRVLREALPDHAATAFVTATLPEWMVRAVQRDLPLTKVLRGPALHRTAAGVRSKLVDCSTGEHHKGDGDGGFGLKAAAMLRELEAEPTSHALIFCNTIESCRRVENFLRRRDRRGEAYEVHTFHGAIPADARKRTLAAFTEERKGVYSLPRLLVCTDRASRGMDFQSIDHVVLFDFPRDGVEYVRRVGRATRGTRRPGRVTSLVQGRQLGYARELMKADREGGAVDLDVHGSSRGDDF